MPLSTRRWPVATEMACRPRACGAGDELIACVRQMYLERTRLTHQGPHRARKRTAVVVRRAMSTFRGQLVALLGVGVLLPVLIRHGLPGSQLLESASVQNSIYACLIAAMGGLIVMRRVSAFPGTTSFSLIVPSYAMTYALVSVMLLTLRSDYSASLLGMSFVASAATGFAIVQATRNSAILPFFLLPNGSIELMHEAPEVNWILLSEPALPTHPEAVIVADLRADHGFEWEQMLARAALAGIPVYHSKNVRESITGKVHIEHLSENHLGSLSVDVVYRKLKRISDLVVCSSALILLTLPMTFIALLIRLDSPGPAIFRQKRIGYGGVPFQILKFRTMRSATPVVDDARGAAKTQTDDARITKVGRYLRKSRLDELPQLINVIFGQMSLIGPRPEAVPLSEWYKEEVPFYLYRHIVRPGITGWAQVNQGHVAELLDVQLKLHYDFYYIKNFSFWLDLLIAIKTAKIMVSGFGAK